MKKNHFHSLWAKMARIRLVEEEIANRYPEGKMRCPTHLSIGQEAVAVAVGDVSLKEDYAVSTHRAHAHYLGKGGDLKAMIAEIYGKEAGCARGRGGSMHLIDRSVGFMGSSAIVGNSIPLGVGLGLAAKLDGAGQVSFVFLGDGAVEEGVFYESVNFAILKKLPVVFVCENNLYSVYSPLAVRQPEGRQISKLAAGLGIKSENADGNDLSVALEVLKNAVKYCRGGNGPVFLEFSTYRWREHCGPNFDNDIGYRTDAEFEQWRLRDPVETLARLLRADDPDFVTFEQRTLSDISDEIDAAFLFAEDAPFPSEGANMLGEYAECDL